MENVEIGLWIQKMKFDETDSEKWFSTGKRAVPERYRGALVRVVNIRGGECGEERQIKTPLSKCRPRYGSQEQRRLRFPHWPLFSQTFKNTQTVLVSIDLIIHYIKKNKL